MYTAGCNCTGRDGRDGRDGMSGPPGQEGDAGPQGPPGPAGSLGGGTTYVRWGRTSCPEVPGTEVLYSGRAAKGPYSQTGNGINHQCFPNNPQYSAFSPGPNTILSLVSAAEYASASIMGVNIHDNVPCVVCYVSTRIANIMIPATMTCPEAWTREYHGYLMAERNTHPSPSLFECVDADAEVIDGLAGNNEPSGYFVNVEAVCATMACPPYSPEKELTCVVCTK